MTDRPETARTIDLLKWVNANPNQAFDPNMVVKAIHTSDWQWQAVIAQMEDLRRQNYLMKLKQDPLGSTYWSITPSGKNYLSALAQFEKKEHSLSVNHSSREQISRKLTKGDVDEWDVFISHASEDKNAIARPLAEALRTHGLRVWYDEFSLTVGDSLRKKIDQGLANSRFGIVILSAKFFEKHWPERELNGLATREVEGEKVILPIWHGVTFKDVQRFSPMLADRIAVNTDKGFEHVIQELMKVMRPTETLRGGREQLNVEPHQQESTSKLVISQKKDPGYYDVKRLQNGEFFIFATLIISNQSIKGNSVVEYEASIMKTDLSYTPVIIEQGKTDNFAFSVTPVNIPGYSTVETVVGFFDVAPQRFGQPFKMKVTAIDMYGQRFRADIDFAKPSR
jgi:hypothetical protein